MPKASPAQEPPCPSSPQREIKKRGMSSSPHLKRPVDPSFRQPRYCVHVVGPLIPQPAVLSAEISRRRPPSARPGVPTPSDPVRGSSDREPLAAFSLFPPFPPLSPCPVEAKCLLTFY